MQNKILFFGLIFITLFAKDLKQYELGGQCRQKYILEGNRLILDVYSDQTKAYNGIASCASLHSDDDTACCYIKVKFENENVEKKYTHRGCVQVTGEQWNNIEGLIDSYEGSNANQNITIKDVDIDCHSRLLKLTGLVLLAFLL